MYLIIEDAYAVLKLIKEFRKDVLNIFFEEDKTKVLTYDYNYTPRYCSKINKISNVITVSGVFGIEILDLNRKEMDRRIVILQTEKLDFGDFDDFLTFFEKVFRIGSYQLRHEINLLDCKERERLNEALNCYIQGLNYSTIVMSVSAIENRLYSLMKSKCPEAKLDDLTLGQLIGEYTNNKEKYGKVIPRKHESLLDYCNNYRIFSVHPKKEKINSANATAILCMTCSFLFDKDMKASKEEGLLKV